MTRILMTTDAVGGVWTYALDLCQELAAHGVHVDLATMGPLPSASQVFAAQSLPNVTLHTSDHKLEWMDNPWEDVARAGDWLLAIAQQVRPDVVHLNGYVHAALQWNAPVLVVAHSCVVSWWAAVKNEPLPDQWLDYAARVSCGLRSAARVVAPTRAMLDSLRMHYRELPPATVISNGRSPARYRVGKKEELVLSAGRMWDQAKNLSALDEAARGLSWPVLVAGDGGEPGATAARCLGRLDERTLADYLARAAIYAAPARYEPFGLSILEAAMCGCALVLGDIPSLREVWADAALFVPPDNPAALRGALRRYIEGTSLRTTMARRALRRARRYSAAHMAQEYFALYEELTGAAPGGRRRCLELTNG